MVPPFDIQIEVETPRPKVSRARLQKNIRAILRALGWKKAALSVSLVSDRKIRSVNKRYLNHDYATDVISFSQIEGRPLGGKPERPFLGDIVISLETTARQAAQFGNSFDDELYFYLCHGILHLMGWDDSTRKAALKMEAKQKKILRQIGLR